MAIHRNITNGEELKGAIKQLEVTVKGHEEIMKHNFAEAKQHFKPANVIKNTFSYIAETPEIQRTLINTAIGFIMGYASKKSAEVLNEEALDLTISNFITHQLTKYETKEPESLLARGISVIRRFTPPTSPIYPFVRYK